MVSKGAGTLLFLLPTAVSFLPPATAPEKFINLPVSGL